MMNILPITNTKDYEAALERVQELMDAERDTPEGAELEILTLVVEAYENTQYPIGDPDPINFLKDVMEFRGYTQRDLARLLDSRPRASEILNRQRPLTLSMIRLINQIWQVPVGPLIREYDIAS
jgi:HTH-type transcriptional regulator/antitoxin HigA